eukprot:3818032-Lingulodinium_polyedra.AAC.1
MIGLDWIGLDWIGLDWTGLVWSGQDRADLHWPNQIQFTPHQSGTWPIQSKQTTAPDWAVLEWT